MSRRWQKVEIQYLTKHAGDKTHEQLAERFHTDVAEVKAKLIELGLLDDPAGRAGELEAAALVAFEQGITALYAGKFAAAVDAFQTVIKVGDEAPELAARGRQYLELASRQLGDAPAEDAYAKAVWAKNSGDLKGALATASKLAARDERFAYLAAATAALAGDHDKALEHLGTAIELFPRNRQHAANDPDFEALRGDGAFAALVRG